jgi:hypothetical protein
MTAPWEKFSLPRWATPLDPSVRLATSPMPPFGGLGRELWPGIGANESLPLPEVPIPSNPQSGLLASLNARARGGFLGRLAAPPQHLDSARYWEAMAAPLGMSARIVPVDALHLGSVPYTPSSESLPTRPQARMAQLFAEPASRSPLNAPEGASDRGGWTNEDRDGIS